VDAKRRKGCGRVAGGPAWEGGERRRLDRGGRRAEEAVRRAEGMKPANERDSVGERGRRRRRRRRRRRGGGGTAVAAAKGLK